MSWGLKRYYGAGHLHFITCSQRYGFVVVGYVVMPEHFHVLISEPETGTPATVMQVLKQRFAPHVLHAQRQRGSTSQGLLWEPEPRQAGALLRLQRLEPGQTSREAALHARESGQATPGARTRTMGLEQLPWLCFR